MARPKPKDEAKNAQHQFIFPCSFYLTFACLHQQQNRWNLLTTHSFFFSIPLSSFRGRSLSIFFLVLEISLVSFSFRLSFVLLLCVCLCVCMCTIYVYSWSVCSSIAVDFRIQFIIYVYWERKPQPFLCYSFSLVCFGHINTFFFWYGLSCSPFAFCGQKTFHRPTMFSSTFLNRLFVHLF